MIEKSPNLFGGNKNLAIPAELLPVGGGTGKPPRNWPGTADVYNKIRLAGHSVCDVFFLQRWSLVKQSISRNIP